MARIGLRRAAASVFAAVLALTLAACTATPLYAPRVAAAPVAAELAQIRIPEVTGRLSQIVRNELIFSLSGGRGQPAVPKYELSLSATGSGGGASAGASITGVAVTYTLMEIATGQAVTTGSVLGTASYEAVTNQAFASTRTAQAASELAARNAAIELHTALALALAE